MHSGTGNPTHKPLADCVITQPAKGLTLCVYPSLASTNDTAKGLCDASHGTIIVADTQTAGRGRHGRKFYSPSGCGIYMSLILDPQRTSTPISLLTPAAAVAVCETIEHMCDKKPQIKWVNDVLLEGKKICGILTEAVIDNNGDISRVVVGIGVNFITPPGGYPPDIADTTRAIFDSADDVSPRTLPSDLFTHTAGEDEPYSTCSPHITREQLITEIATRLVAGYEKGQLNEAYKKRLAYVGRRVYVIACDTTYEATALGVDRDFGLVVQTDTGELVALTSGEISIRLANAQQP